jgi:iron complex outermembrane receptor protein
MRNKLSDAIKLANKSALMLGSAAAIAMMGVASGVQAQAQDADVTEEVVVTGIRGSLKQSIDVKRNSATIVDAINAEDIGKFPDRNAAESLSRIPGVNVSREFGEGEKVNIRGTSSDYNRTLLNGQTVASADWFILDNPNRSFNYTLLPSVLIGTVEVHKSPEASQEEGSLGGTVIIKTRTPLEQEANSFTASLEGQYQETSEEIDPQISAQYSWKNDSETLGALISVTKQDRTLVREGFEVLGWGAEDEDGVSRPSQPMGAPHFEQERERETIFASLQAAPTDSLTMTLNLLNSKMDANNQNANWLIWPITTGDDGNETPGAAIIENDSVVYNESENVNVGVNWINRVSSTETASYNFETKYETDAFTATGVVGFTEAKGGTSRETSWEYVAAGSSAGFDLREPGLASDPAPADASEFAAGWIWGGSKPTTDEETYAQVDLMFPVELGAFNAIKVGAKVRDAERTQDRHAYSWHANPVGDAGGYLWHIFEECPNLATCDLDALGTQSVDAPVAGNFLDVVKQNRAVMEEIAFVGLNGVPATYAIWNNLPEIWTVQEDITALYVQTDFEAGALSGNIGVRYVDTAQTSGGYEYIGAGLQLVNVDEIEPEWVVAAIGPAEANTSSWATADNDYSETLPSLNVKYDLNDEMALRFSAARVMARQNQASLSPYETNGSLNVPEPTGTAGNPMLKPTLADQYDLSYEWYLADASLVSAAYFFKDVESYIGQETYVEPRYWEEEDTMVDVEFKRPTNAEGGTVSGLELAALHTFENGFGLTANYTYTDAKTDDPEAFTPGVSENMYNLSAFFENDLLSARVMYNFRTDWYKGRHFNGNNYFNDEFGQWDATFSYNIMDGLSLSLEALNLTDEQVIEYADDNESRLMSIYENGRRLTVGLRYQF